VTHIFCIVSYHHTVRDVSQGRPIALPTGQRDRTKKSLYNEDDYLLWLEPSYS
jgi:hypothetical protein